MFLKVGFAFLEHTDIFGDILGQKGDTDGEDSIHPGEHERSEHRETV